MAREHIESDHDVAVVRERVHRGLIIGGRGRRAFGRQHFFDDAARALEGPGDDVELRGLRVPRVLRGDDLAVLGREQCPHGRGDDANALAAVALELRSARQIRGDGGVIEIDGLAPEARLVRDPVQDVFLGERLRPDSAGRDARRFVVVDHGLGVFGLAAEYGRGLELGVGVGRLQLGSEVAAKRVQQLNALLMRKQRATRAVQIGAPLRRAALILLGRFGRGHGSVHLAFERLEFGDRQIARAAQGGSRFDELARGIELSGGEGFRALCGERSRENVGRGVEVTLIVTANELAVFGEGNVALLDARAHSGAGFVTFLGVLRELERAAAAVADREFRLVKRTFRA